MSLASVFRLTCLLTLSVLTFACTSSQEEAPADATATAEKQPASVAPAENANSSLNGTKQLDSDVSLAEQAKHLFDDMEPISDDLSADELVKMADELKKQENGCRSSEGTMMNFAPCKKVAGMYEKAIEGGVKNDKAYGSLAWICRELTRYDDEGRFVQYGGPDDLNQKWRYKMMATARRGLALYPNSTLLLHALRKPILRGEGYVTEEEYAEFTRRLRALEPDRSDWLLADYEELVKQGKVQKAVNKYLEYVEAIGGGETNDIIGHVDRAKALGEKGHRAEALRIYEAILDLSSLPMQSAGWRRRDRRYSLCGFVSEHSLPLGDYFEFPDFVERVKKLRPFCTPEEHLLRGEAALRAGNPHAAVEELALQLEENPYPPMTYIYLAEAYDSLGRTNEAGEVVKRYFDFEKDTIYRCIYLKPMLERGFQQRTPEIMREVGEQCMKWRKGEGKD